MKNLSFLIIDDEVVDRAYYQRMLRQSLGFPYKAVEATNAKEAITAIKNGDFDCVLLDYQLPDMNGIDLLKKLKKIGGKFLPILMLTGRGDEDIAVKALKAGAIDYLNKNKIEPESLTKTIISIIRNSQLKKIIYQQKRQLKYYAYYDNLTGLMNRHTFEEMSKRALSDASRLHHSLSIIFIDVKNFMAINDSLGYLAGDEILIEIGKRLNLSFPKNTIVARFSDDEFAITITGTTKDNLAHLVQNVLNEIKKPFHLSIETVLLSANAGIAIYPQSGETLEQIIKNANIALNNAKKSKKDDYLFYAQI